MGRGRMRRQIEVRSDGGDEMSDGKTAGTQRAEGSMKVNVMEQTSREIQVEMSHSLVLG